MHRRIQINALGARWGRYAWLTALLWLGACVGAVDTFTPSTIVADAVTPAAPSPDTAATLAALTAADPPPRDLADLAGRYLGVDTAPPAAAPSFQPGDRALFWYRSDGGSVTLQAEAVLRYQSDTLNMWVEDGARVRDTTLARAAARLEDGILTDVRAFFGRESQPGIDGDSRLSILHVRDAGGAVAGYFTAADLYPAAVTPYSNEREMLTVNLRNARLGSDTYYSVIAHELQHLIQAHTDLNEATWVDEGMAELAAYLAGVQAIDHVQSFDTATDVQLTDFSQTDQPSAHYAASFLFSAYFFDRYGEAATRALVRHPENGAAGFSAALADSGVQRSFNDLFAEWQIVNYLISHAWAPERTYGIDIAPIEVVATVDPDGWRYPDAAAGEETVAQYGTDYFAVRGQIPVTLTFTGAATVTLIDAMPRSGAYYWTTVPADRSDMTLTRAFDLSGVDSAALTFWTWYAIETGWDYGYVAASADGGATWTPLETELTTRENPHGNSYGPALTGRSGGWVRQSADLTPFAGDAVLVRFEYITDDAVVDQGWAIDDVAIPAIGYAADFEAGADGWQGAGWVRHTNVLPQTYIVQLAARDRNGGVTVTPLMLAADGRGAFQLPLSPAVAEIVIAVSGATPLTTQRATYQYTISR